MVHKQIIITKQITNNKSIENVKVIAAIHDIETSICKW